MGRKSDSEYIDVSMTDDAEPHELVTILLLLHKIANFVGGVSAPVLTLRRSQKRPRPARGVGEGLSWMRGNSHVRFLRGRGGSNTSPLPEYPKAKSRLGHDFFLPGLESVDFPRRDGLRDARFLASRNPEPRAHRPTMSPRVASGAADQPGELASSGCGSGSSPAGPTSDSAGDRAGSLSATTPSDACETLRNATASSSRTESGTRLIRIPAGVSASTWGVCSSMPRGTNRFG